MCLLVLGVQIAGCGLATEYVVDKRYYFVEPSFVSLGEGRIPCEAGHKGPPPPDGTWPTSDARQPVTTLQLHASDTLVTVYADCVKKMLRARMNLARIARLTSSTFAVLTAAAAAALGAVATAPLTAITALAAASAVTPEFMRIFGADERARAYDEGVHLIEDAEAQYVESLAGQGTPTVPNDRMTQAGAKLYMQTVASLKIVENLLVAQLPKIEDIQRAQGRVAELGLIQVQSDRISLTNEGETVEIVVLGGVVTGALSSNTAHVVIVDDPARPLKDGVRRVKVRAVKPGPANVILSNDAGRTRAVSVVVAPPELVLAVNSPSSVTAGGEIVYKALVGVGGAAGADVVTLDVRVTGATAWKQQGNATLKPSAADDRSACAPVSNGSDQGLQCTFAPMPVGKVAEVTIEATAPPDPDAKTKVTFRSDAWSGTSQAAPTASAKREGAVAVVPKVVLEATGLAPASAAVATPFSYTVNVVNKGPSTAKQIEAKVKLSGPAAFGAAPSGCTGAGDTEVTCRTDSVEPGKTISFALPATANAPGAAAFETTVTGTQNDDKPATAPGKLAATVTAK